MDFFKIQINGDTWVIYLVPDQDGVISDIESGAATDIDAKEIYFRPEDLDFRIVLHELWHAHFGYCYLRHTTELSLDDMEEISASLFADRGERIIALSKEIFTRLVEMRETNG